MKRFIGISRLACLLFLCMCAHVEGHAQIKVACIGNSITFGSGIENRAVYSYPAQLQLILGDQWEVRNFGVSGRTMLKKGNQPIWNEDAFAQALAYQPDVVIIKLGTNDSKTGNWQHKAEFKPDYQAMVDTFKSVGHPMIFVCRPVPAFGNSWTISSAVVANEIVPIIDEIGKENSLQVIDLFTPFRSKKDLFPDLIHPNGHGAALMAGIIARDLMKNYTAIVEQKIFNSNN
ncbi:MAG: GDSL-type esterase/lipase family protein [Bacteroidota bacterium]